MNVFRSVALTVVLLTALSTSGLAQETKAPEAGPASAEKPQTAPPAPPVAPAKAARATDFTLGLGYHGVTHLTGSATLMWGTARMFGALAPGKLIQVRGGARGGQVGVGFVGGAFEESPIRPSGVAATFKAILIRTWRDPTLRTNGNTYAGIESDVVLLGFRGSAGYAWKVGGAGAPGGRFVWSLGLGL